MKTSKRRMTSAARAAGKNFQKIWANAPPDEELKRRLQRAVKSIQVPAGLEARVLKFIKTDSDFAKNGDKRGGN